jgi:hypothetical protein
MFTLGIFMAGTICKNRKFLTQTFRSRYQVGKNKCFRKCHLALTARENKSQLSGYSTSVLTEQGRRLKKIAPIINIRNS